MNIFKNSIFSIFLIIASFTTSAHAATFTVQNNCPYTIWAAAVPGGGQQLDTGQLWILNFALSGRIWARTNCNFNGTTMRGRCETGDCGGLLECQDYGEPPNTLAEYMVNQKNNLHIFDISLVQGFNVPMEFSPTSNGCTTDGIKCGGDIIKECPNELRVTGGCNNPCTVFKTSQYCCNSGSCGPTNYSKFFKDRCPHAYSYPLDDQTITFTCPIGTNYRVVFCPGIVVCSLMHEGTCTPCRFVIGL